jgi:peptidyl-prolyl cis-trans isomerase SurA
VQDDPNWPSPGPVDVASLPPIHSVINHGTTDPDALLAGRESSEARTQSTGSPRPFAGEPIVLGPLKKSTESIAESNLANSPAAEPVSPSASPEPAAPPMPPSQAFAAAETAPPPAATSLPAMPAIPARDDSVRPTTSEPPATLPPAMPATSAPNAATSRTDGEVSGSIPKEIDFEGLPATAVSAGRPAAKVGMKVITVYDLNLSIQEWIRNNVPEGQSIPRREGLFIAKMVLSQMIDRMLIVEEANRLMKSEKQKEALFSQIEQVWQEQQIPPMLKKYKVDTPYELDQALKKQGKSLEAARKEFQDEAIAHEFMGMKLGSKTFVSLVEMRRYYNEHLNDFDRPAQLTWREIRIPIESGKEAATQDQCQEILAQLKAKADFTALAKRFGKGPTADQGGLWETSPGAFAIAEVNQALESLQPGQTSGIIPTANSLFIVKLESRREAGPARFDEVQSDIKKKLSEEKLGQAASEYLKDLRRRTIVSTIFDDIPDPRQALADKQLQQTAGRLPTASAAQASPQSTPPPMTAFPDEPTSIQPLPNLNPAGPVPPRGVMSGPPVSPL